MKKILIVEDSSIASGLLSSCQPEIERQVNDTLDVETAESYEEVEALCRNEVFPFDCVTVDMRIFRKPGHTREAGEVEHTAWGLRALREVERRLPLRKILIITSHFLEVEPQLTDEELEQVREKQVHSAQFIREVVVMLTAP